MKHKGFTLIELMIVVAIIGIILAVLAPVFSGTHATNSNVTWGVNGTTEVRCINSMEFVIDPNGNAQQMIGPNGGAVSCNN